jgi:hypothetical protein
VAFERGAEVFDPFFKNERNRVMGKFNPYDKIIENKLAHLPEEGADLLWKDMKAILDKRMPQQKENPKLWGWSCLELGALALGSVFIMVTGVSALFPLKGGPMANRQLVQGGGKSNAAIAVKALPAGEYANGNTASYKPHVTNPVVQQPVARTRSFASHDRTQGSPEVPTAYRPISRGEVARRQIATIVQEPGTLVSSNRQEQEASAGGPVLLKDYKGARAYITSLVNGNLEQPAMGPLSLDSGVVANRSHLPGAIVDQKTFDSIFTLQKKMLARYRQTGFYAAIMGGVDLSSIQLRSMQPGSNKGIVAGYAFTRRWSVESGLFWNKKNFKGHGGDIHPDGYTLPAGVTLLSVQGRNQLYEWPLNIRYSILPNDHKLFVTAGLSSYFIKKESYNYNYEYNGQYGVSYSGFDNETKQWFSVASVSLGYSRRLGSVGSARIEPYLKLPLKNIGVNKMAVLSTGLNIGFTRGLLK